MILAWLFVVLALGQDTSALSLCMVRYDIPCAEAEVRRLGLDNSTDPTAMAIVADVQFFAGRYPEAYDTLSAAIAAGYEDKRDDLAQYERTMFATAGWVEERRGRFIVRWRPGMDDLIVEDAFDALERAETHIAPVIGGPPPGTTILEIYPDSRSFIAASSLTADDVYTTGTVALSKWSRLLVTSPRSRGQGYGWQDTIAHEYIHLVVAYRGNGTQRSVPVWLQEAIAKYLDSRWRDGQDRFALSYRQEAAIGEALAADSLVTFEEMHPSLAKLPTAERAALAYAQLASLMQYSFAKGGEDVLLRCMEQTKNDVDSRAALASAVGEPSFESLEAGWLSWLRSQELGGVTLDELPTVLDGGSDTESDPLLANDRRMADMVDLGDLLASYDEHEAALVEYRKALSEDDAPSPLLSVRMASAYVALNRSDEAVSELQRSLKAYPEYPLTWKTLGEAHEQAGRLEAAWDATTEASRSNPFDPAVRERLVRLARARGDSDEVARQERLLALQLQGGGDVERPAIHERFGTYELPRLEEHVLQSRKREQVRDEWIGKPAPSWLALDVNGGEIDPAKFEGSVVVLDFWATWCGPCRQAMPALAELHTRLEDQGVSVVGLTDEDPGRVRPFLAKMPMPYPIGVRAGDVKARFKVRSLPTVFVIDRKGRVVDVIVGAGDAAHARIEAAVAAALEP